jgi:Virulence protein RhuM family
MANKKLQIRNSTAEFLIFNAQGGEDGIEVRYQHETIWLSQKMIATLFGCSTDNISLHLKNIFKEGELVEKPVSEEFSVTAGDGKNYKTRHYNLDAIIACGYRVNSARATQFRQWATSVLRDFAIRGYVLDKERMKNGTFLSQECSITTKNHKNNANAGARFQPRAAYRSGSNPTKQEQAGRTRRIIDAGWNPGQRPLLPSG